MEKSKHICYIALGSNQNNPQEQVLSAIRSLQATPSLQVLDCSKLYVTKPQGYIEQPDFINAVIKIQTGLTAHSLLRKLLDLEKQHLRARSKNQNGPRTLDLDLLLYDNRTIITKELIVPHPRMWKRDFVLIPLQELGIRACKQ
jgi:2-amino-4-hydroxy-6-hydroxymethyldihydropteridine diphosphokinase